MSEKAPGLTHVELTGTVFPNLALKVGGHLLPFTRLAFDSGDEGKLPQITISLPVAEGVVWSLQASCGLDESSRAALVAMGWTPPAADDEPAQRQEITSGQRIPVTPGQRYDAGAAVRTLPPAAIVRIGGDYYRVTGRTVLPSGAETYDLEPLDAAAVQAIVSPA